MIYALKTPVNFEGSDVTEVELNFEDLSYNDLEKSEKHARLVLGKKENMPVPELNFVYLLSVAARAANVPFELLKSLRANDVTQIKMLTQNFLLDGDTEETEE